MIHRIYQKELEIKDTTDTVMSPLYLDLHLEINCKGKILTKLYDKRDDFSFRHVNFPFIHGNIPSTLVYGLFISQLIYYARACRNYTDFLYRNRILTNRLSNRIMLLQDSSHHYRGFMVVTMNLSIITVYLSAP